MTKEQMINFVNYTHPYTFEFSHVYKGYRVYKADDKFLEVKHEPEIEPPKHASGYNLLKDAIAAKYQILGIQFSGFESLVLTKYKVGDWVRKYQGYEFIGEVRAAFTKTTGQTRYVVEEGKSGMLHIFNDDQLVPFEGKPVRCEFCKNYHYAMH
jgi:hypothetical protein